MILVVPFNTSSIDVNFGCDGLRTSMISYIPPTPISSFNSDSRDIEPFCSNLRKVGRGTPDRSARVSCVSSIDSRRRRRFLVILTALLEIEISDSIVVVSCV